MTKETMNVHKALSELKTIDDRIESAIHATSFCVAHKCSNEKINGVAIADYIGNVKSNYQKINDLIARRRAIKNAVTLSNAKTMVEILGDKYTVAEAIEMKNNGIDNYSMLLNVMTDNYKRSSSTINSYSGEDIEKKAEEYVTNMINAMARDSKTPMGAATIQSIRDEYIKNNTYELIDPVNIVNEITSLNEYISTFKSEIDAALSVSNATTLIDIEY